MKKKNQLYTLGLALLFAAAFPACTQNDDETGEQQPEGKILLSPTVGLEGWNKSAGTRADASIAVALAEGGALSVMLQTVGENDKPATAGTQMNRFEVTADGKLSRIAYSGVEYETEPALNIAAPGDHFVTVSGEANCILDGITFSTVIGTTGGAAQKVNIDYNGKLSIPCVLLSGGLRLNAKSTSGGNYTGANVTANLKNVQQYNSGTFKEKTLTAAAASALWGDIDPASSVAVGTTLMELVVGNQKYEVKAPRQITFGKGRLYTFNVRVGATSIIVSSDDLAIADFEVQASTDVEVAFTPSLNGHQALAVNGYWVADASPSGKNNTTYKHTNGVLKVCPAGWRLPSIADFESMLGVKLTKGTEVNIPDGTKADFLASFPYFDFVPSYEGSYYGVDDDPNQLNHFIINSAQTTIKYDAPASVEGELTEDAGCRVRCVKEQDVPYYEGQPANRLALSGAVPYWIAPKDLKTNVAWSEVAGSTCPAGWSIPTKTDIEDMLGAHINYEIPGINEIFGLFDGAGNVWTSTEVDGDKAYILDIDLVGSAGLNQHSKSDAIATSIRCVRKK